ncbi:MAG: ATP-binding cassette domain-containing protein, partial [Actinobacteria bacterium]|nr:ATP-binding cassette domain-containing protein [Actinomycetota bacterium]
MSLLDVRGVMVRFGGVMAVGGVNLSAEAGQVTGLIGPNGAGKTTLFNVISGMQEPTAGEVYVSGINVTHEAPHRRAKRGLARTFQRLELFASLSVRDNVRVAAELAGVPDVNGTVEPWTDHHSFRATRWVQSVFEMPTTSTDRIHEAAMTVARENPKNCLTHW